MEAVKWINYGIAATFIVCYLYQIVYIVVGCLKKPKKVSATNNHRYAVLIAARNEENVIAALIQSIQRQDYPSELVDIYVIADNCSDRTAEIAREAGAVVFERHSKEKIGKGYALEALVRYVWASGQTYEGYFVFDADNLIDANYVREMNHHFDQGQRVITGYRNSKNYADNWISSGYSLWFLRESRFLNQPRYSLQTSCAVSGTGFLVHHDILAKNGGWKHFLLTEDIEFTADLILNGEAITYCSTAVLYDEQPTSFSQSWHQRLRWAKGYLQVFRRYGIRLFERLMSKKHFACLDMILTIMPAIVLTIVGVTVNVAGGIYALVTADTVMVLVGSMLQMLLNTYGFLFLIGVVTSIAEWRSIRAPASRKIASVFTFPIFMMTYIPISLCALFANVTWQPIIHSKTIRIHEIEKESTAVA
ncbi:MAG: glycosyltransferase family 2 protein [Clostridiaceae bacterium]|nr:glycosyltransferase family 2 protein [Clostridiaceae bacterium]